MPTPDPSFIPAQLQTIGLAWQTYSPALLTALLAMIVLVTVPVIAIKGGYRFILRGWQTLFQMPGDSMARRHVLATLDEMGRNGPTRASRKRSAAAAKAMRAGHRGDW